MFSDYRHNLRHGIAALLIGCALASFALANYDRFRLERTQPAQPQPERGLVYPFNNPGGTFYCSALQATQFALSVDLFFALSLLGLFLYGLRLHPKIRRYLSRPAHGHLRYILLSFLLSLPLLWYLRPPLVSLLVARGFILSDLFQLPRLP